MSNPESSRSSQHPECEYSSKYGRSTTRGRRDRMYSRIADAGTPKQHTRPIRVEAKVDVGAPSRTQDRRCVLTDY